MLEAALAALVLGAALQAEAVHVLQAALGLGAALAALVLQAEAVHVLEASVALGKRGVVFPFVVLV